MKKEPQSRKTGRSGRATGDNKIRFTAEEERRYLIPCGVRGQARLGRGRALCPGGGRHPHAAAVSAVAEGKRTGAAAEWRSGATQV